MDIWEKLYEKAKAEYHPEDVMIANAFATSTSMRRVLLCVFNSVL